MGSYLQCQVLYHRVDAAWPSDAKVVDLELEAAEGEGELDASIQVQPIHGHRQE